MGVSIQPLNINFLLMKYLLFYFILFTSVFYCCHPDSDQHTTFNAGYFSPSHEYIKCIGRFDTTDPLKYIFSHPASTISFRFKGKEAGILLNDLTTSAADPAGNPIRNMFNVYVDQEKYFLLELNKMDTVHQLFSGINDTVHTIRIVKRTESLVGKVEFSGIQLEENGVLVEIPSIPERKMEFIGNSITCGYGNEAIDQYQPFSCETENASLAYGAITADRLNAQYVAVAYSGRGIVQNYDGSQVNVVPEIWNRIFPDEDKPLWDHKLYTPDIAVINLGTNDFSSGVDTGLFKQAYASFLKQVRKEYPITSIVCLIGPMLNNSYPENALDISRNIVSSIVSVKRRTGDNKIYFFELTQQTGEYGYGADWHPSVAQHEYNAGELTQYIKEITGW